MNQLSLFDTFKTLSGDGNGASLACSYWKLFVDGASRNNPGTAGAGVYVLKDDQVVEQLGYYLGVKTNNQAEYLALIIGLRFVKAHAQEHDYVMIYSDSQLLVRQIEGVYKIKNGLLKPLHTIVKHLLDGVEYAIGHVMREDNTHADALANKGIDRRTFLGAPDIDFFKKHEISIY